MKTKEIQFYKLKKPLYKLIICFVNVESDPRLCYILIMGPMEFDVQLH